MYCIPYQQASTDLFINFDYRINLLVHNVEFRGNLVVLLNKELSIVHQQIYSIIKCSLRWRLYECSEK